eukprot:CAMPEP_0116032760 /NCGR_PEP_ID=MMETSP0321-20121206/18398_1 /TAXON_ID=163516 /ORGANISM="Leptocylindrus danicus var. danicus, Strain B650" /LENGTH=691 /DNA_ID=CAMNT_0003508331 /DNA_START=33 /DNA_END=2109 /DNA_ORIENTATION=-
MDDQPGSETCEKAIKITGASLIQTEEEALDYSGALALKRNLQFAFDGAEQPPPSASNAATTNPLQSITNTSSNTNNGEKKAVAVSKQKMMEQQWKQAVSKQQNHAQKNRPPMHPSLRAATATAGANHSKQKLNVYLRIRPCLTLDSGNNASNGNTTTVGTIEILPPSSSVAAANNNSFQAIRTYAPIDSNASRCARPMSANASGTPRCSNSSVDRLSGSSSVGSVGRPSSAPSRGRAGSSPGSVPIKEFQFQKVFGPESKQIDVFSETTAPLIDGMFAFNQSALLFAYGITNAGKTYTIGGGRAKEDWGLLPRSLEHIFRKMGGPGDSSFGLNMSYFEIYNEMVYDLVPPVDKSATSFLQRKTNLKVSDRGGHVFVKGLTKHSINSVEHGLQLSRQAMENRQTSSNNLNSVSSRSHCICQLELSNSALGDEKPCTMWIVDLAGSERSKRTGFGGSSKKQREAAQINQSLTTLMRCITQLAGNQRNDGTKVRDNIVPFRDSKLTYLLMNHLSGSDAGRTVMIVNVNPSPTDFDETQHVLSYATVAKDVIISTKEYEKRAIVTKSATARSRSKPRPMKRACSFMHMESVEECQDEMDALEVRHQKEVHALKARMAKLEQTKIEGDEEGTTRRDIIVQDGRIRKGRLNSEDNESLVAPFLGDDVARLLVPGRVSRASKGQEWKKRKNLFHRQKG